jgi:putative peptide zinc metalloprotease protein
VTLFAATGRGRPDHPDGPLARGRDLHTDHTGHTDDYPPRLATGVELLGEFKDSGFSQPPFLVRRADGQVIQMSRLLYLVASQIDGARNADAIAAEASADLGRSLTPDQVRYLITGKLLPLGVVADPSATVRPPRANALLTLRARGTLLPERAVNAIGTLLQPLLRGPVVVTVIATVAAMDYWIFSADGLAAGFGQVLSDPADLLIVAALLTLSAVFHECGHATACRYGGARPGRIGIGLYLVWPSFFTNVTDSYRLGRAGRLRTDLGGLYFNLVFILAMAAIYEATSAAVLLVVIAFSHVEMLEQLLPFVRFDGYFIVGDLLGVPDLFTRTAGLRRRSRILVTCWTASALGFLALTLGYLLLRFPDINRALWHSASHQARLAAVSFRAGDYAAAAVDAIGAALAGLSVAASLYVVVLLARRAFAVGLRWSKGRFGRRAVALTAALAVLTSLAAYWTTQGQFLGWLPWNLITRPFRYPGAGFPLPRGTGELAQRGEGGVRVAGTPDQRVRVDGGRITYRDAPQIVPGGPGEPGPIADEAGQAGRLGQRVKQRLGTEVRPGSLNRQSERPCQLLVVGSPLGTRDDSGNPDPVPAKPGGRDRLSTRQLVPRPGQQLVRLVEHPDGPDTIGKPRQRDAPERGVDRAG